MTKKEKEIAALMEKLDISKREAEDLYEFDHKTDAQQKEELEFFGVADFKKEKEEKKEKKKNNAIAKVKTMKRKEQADENKEEIKKAFLEWFNSCDCVKNPQEVKNNQFCFMDKDGNYYSFKLTKHIKGKPDGYGF